MIEKTLPTKQVENSLSVAYEKAAVLLRQSSPEKVCETTGARFQKKLYQLVFLNTNYQIQMPRVSFVNHDVPLIVQVLILHYLTARDIPESKGEYINFSTIPGGMFYYKSFKRRAIDRLTALYDREPERLIHTAEKLGGGMWKQGGLSVEIPIFPLCGLVVQYYPGDEEFSCDANILFPENIGKYLPIEDIAFLGGYIVSRLKSEN